MSNRNKGRKGEQSVGNVADGVRILLAGSVAAFVNADAARNRMTEGRTGGYTSVVNAAILANDAKLFETVADHLFADIRANREGLGKQLGCKLGKGKKGSAPGYLIPASIMSAKSVMLAAYKYAVPLTDTDDGKAVARSFTAIRSDVSERKAADDVAAMDARGKQLHAIRALCGEIAESAEAYTVTEADKVIELLTKIRDAAATVTEASKGEELAENADADAPDYEADEQEAAAA